MTARDQADNRHERRVLDHPILGEAALPELVEIIVDGQPLNAYSGEPIAAALMANGIDICRAMPESGESRGPFCAVGRCSDCLMIVDGVLNVRTCITPVTGGMRVETQHGLGHWEEEAV